MRESAWATVASPMTDNLTVCAHSRHPFTREPITTLRVEPLVESGIDRSTRIKYAASTAPTQIVLAFVLAFAFSRSATISSNGSEGWGDLIGYLVGMVLGPAIGLALIIVLVLRRSSTSVLRTLIFGTSAAVATWVVEVLTLATIGNLFAMLAVVATLSTSAVWIVSGRRDHGVGQGIR